MNKEAAGAIVVCLVLLLGFGGCCGGCIAYRETVVSEGFRDGEIQKFSHKGFFWKTWEGELAMQGLKRSGGGDVGGSVFEFTVTDEAMAKKINEVPPGSKVRLHYHEIWWTVPWEGATSYRVTGIDECRKEEK